MNILKSVKIKRIKRDQITLKSGKRAGETANTCNICVQGKNGDQWLNGFESAVNKTWQVGDTVEVELIKKEGKDGKVYWNHKTPKPDYMQMITELTDRVTRLELEVSNLKEKKNETAPEDESEADLPWE